MNILDDLRSITNKIHAVEKELEALKTQRNQMIVDARSQNKTWQSISEHSDLTIQGTRNAADKHHSKS